jgi:putative ABC transport system ATP-binding protein
MKLRVFEHKKTKNEIHHENKDDFLIRLKEVTKTFNSQAGVFTAVDNINLKIKEGEFIAIVGKSGSGKSTLLNMLSGIDRPSSGEVSINGSRLNDLDQSSLANWRGQNIGIIFQFFQLLPTLTVIENVMLPMDFCNTYPADERRERALALLDQVGMAEHANKLPATLSGGEQQRVAFARALANNPPVIVADEPTGNLDSKTSELVLNLFSSLIKEGKTVVMVTHEREVSKWVTRTVTIKDGRIKENVSRGVVS